MNRALAIFDRVLIGLVLAFLFAMLGWNFPIAY